MPLDPQARTLLDQLAALGFADFAGLSPQQARDQMGAFPRPEGPEVAKVEDRSVPAASGPIPVRVYTPQGAGAKPGIVYFHGGGWVIGNIESHDATCRSLANASASVVVSVDYRLAPEHKFPAAPEDSYAATQWVVANAQSLGIDARRLAVAGDSAGGNLAAAVALMARDRGGPAISFQLLVYPVTNHAYDTASYRDNAEGYLLTKGGMVWFWDHYLRSPADGADPLASPLRAPSLAGLPPALVLTAEFDPLRDEGEAYGARLKEAGVRIEVRRYDGMIHGFFGNVALDQGRAAIDDAAEALRNAFAAVPA
ncbi:MAG: alpha/beta hydrolase [Tepidiformaceae bacterium]